MRDQLLVAALALTLLGCGGAAHVDDLFPHGASDASAPASDPPPLSPQPGDGDDSGATGTGSTAIDGGLSSSASDAASPPDASAHDAGTTTHDSGVTSAGPDPGIWCGTNGLTGNDVYCELGSALCCMTPSPAPTNYACIASTATCPGIPAACDKEADCAGGMCCADASGTTYGPLHCAASCSASDARFCDPSAKPDECASVGLACKADEVLIGYYSCG